MEGWTETGADRRVGGWADSSSVTTVLTVQPSTQCLPDTLIESAEYRPSCPPALRQSSVSPAPSEPRRYSRGEVASHAWVGRQRLQVAEIVHPVLVECVPQLEVELDQPPAARRQGEPRGQIDQGICFRLVALPTERVGVEYCLRRIHPGLPRIGLATHREVRAGELAQGPSFEPGSVRRPEGRDGRKRLVDARVLAVHVIRRTLEVEVGGGVILELSLEPAQYRVALCDIVDLQTGTRIDLIRRHGINAVLDKVDKA